MINRRQGMQRVLWLILLLPLICYAAPTRIATLRVSAKLHHWRLVFDANQPIQYHKILLKNPERVVLDIHNAKLVRPIHRANLIGTPVSRIRSSRKANHLRLVLDLDYKVKIKVFTLKAPYRLVVDMTNKRLPVYGFNTEHRQRAKVVKQTHKVVKPAQRIIKPKKLLPIITASTSKRDRSKDVIVVIDPGHGGKDPGAIGYGRTYEKNVVLAISKKLQQVINRQPGFKAVLTRKGDYYLTLRQRLMLARRDKADMFVAIHADAYRNRSAHGASVYALSQRGATSEAARWLAKRENKSELMGGVKLQNKSNMLRSVLISLSQTATIRASLQIGQDLINSLRHVSKLHHNRVEQAAFVVLKSPDIPSLLVETGFLSNRYESRRLRSRAYQYKIAYAVMRGIRRYFIKRPPRGTWLATRKQLRGRHAT